MEQLGGFSFGVSVDVSAAQRGLQQLVAQSQRAAQQVQAAFSGGNIRGLNLQTNALQIAQQIQQATQAAQAFSRVRVQPLNLQTNLNQVAQQAAAARTAVQQLGQTPTRVNVTANLSDVQAGVDRLTQSARALGQTRLNLRINADETRTAAQAVAQMAAALRAAKAGEVISLDVRTADVQRADQLVRQLTADINAARAAGAQVVVNTRVNDPSRSFFSEAGRGFLQQATPGLATGFAAATGVVAAQAVGKLAEALAEATAAGIRYNAMLETSAVQLKVFLGGNEEAAAALEKLRRNADVTPFSTEEVVRSGAAFARVAEGNIARMERLLDLAEQLAAVNPNPRLGGGLEGATVALREALAGDFTSIRERFNVSAAEIQRLRAAGLEGERLAAALVKAAGGSKQLVDQLSNTFSGRLNTATSNIENLRAAATRPLFDVLSAGLKAFNDLIDQNRPKLEGIANLIGRIAPFLGAGAALALPGGLALAGAGVATGVGTVQQPGPSAPAGLSPTAQATQAIRGQIADANAAQNTAISRQKQLVEDLKKEHEHLAAEVKKVTLEYERQLLPLQQQLVLLNAAQRQNDAVQRDIEARRVAAGPSVGVRAEAARQTALLDHEQELTDIRHRRAELGEQIARAEEERNQRVIENQIRAAERALDALREQQQGEKQARDEALEGLREETRVRQENRQVALDGLREIIRARQEERQVALEGLREEIQARQDARREALDAIREQISERRRIFDEAREDREDARREEREAFQDQEREAERAHSREQDRFRDRIDALRAQAESIRDSTERESSARRELAALDAAQRAQARADRIQDARIAVNRATTLLGRQDALRNLRRAERDAEADRKREEIQHRIEQEKQQADRRREQIQQKISELERKAREEDRQYQRERETRRDAFEAQQRAQAQADRVEERAERERRRQEDAQIRAAEKADREATKREQAEIRAAERADKEQTRAENAQLRAQEQADREETRRENARIREEERANREEDRAAQRQLLEAQQAIAESRRALAERKEGFEDVLDAAALQRLREQVDLENRRLDIRQQLIDRTDAVASAQAASDQVFADEVDRILGARRAVIEGQIDAIKDKAGVEVQAIQNDVTALEIKIDAAKKALEELEKGKGVTVPQLGQGQDLSGVPEAGTQSPAVAAGRGIGSGLLAGIQAELTRVTGVIDSATRAIGEGIAAWVKDDTSTGAAVGDWVIKNIIEPIEGPKGLDIGSPSKKAIEWAKSVGEGFLEGFKGEDRKIVDAVEAPWIEIDQQFFPAVERAWRKAGKDHADAYLAGFESVRLPERIEREIREILDRVERSERLFAMAGRRAGREFSEGFCDFLTLIECFKREMEWMVDAAEIYGGNAGVKFSNGFQQRTSLGSGGGGGATGRSGGGQQWFNPYSGQIISSPTDPGWPWEPFGTTPTGGSRAGSRVQTRAIGGPVGPDQLVLAGEFGPELIRLRGSGTVIPHALSMSMLSGAGSVGAASGGMGSPTINVTVNVSGTGLDVNALSQAIKRDTTDAVASALLEHARNYPRRVSPALPGAR